MKGLRLRAIGSLLLLLATACINNNTEIPEGYIEPKKLAEIMLDIHLIEGARSGTLVLGDTNKLPDYYARIYQKHGVSQVVFKESLYWYTQNPPVLKKIFEEVAVELSKMETDVKQRIKMAPDPDVTE